jgi:threonine aldolase
VHHPISKMLVAENTQNRGGGTVWRMDRWERVSGEARKHGLHVHVDGARLFNACVAGGYAPDAFARSLAMLDRVVFQFEGVG